MQEPITVLITGIGGGGHGEQILKALKLSSLDLRLVGTDSNPNSSGFALVEQSHVVPPAADPEYFPAIMELCRRCRARVLLHGSEPELKVLAAHREQIASEGIFLPINPDHVLETCLDKLKTFVFLEKNGFPSPLYRQINSREDIKNFPVFPAVLKPAVGGGGSAMVGLAQNLEEALYYGGQLLSAHRHFIMQEYVGTPDQEFTVGVLMDMDGNLLNSIVLHRQIRSALSCRLRVPNRSGRTALGSDLVISSGISQGAIGPHPEIQRQCEAIALALGVCGPVNIQCRFVEGRVLPFEINPRFSGTSSLRAMVGYNEPEVLIRKHVLGDDIEVHFPYKTALIARSLAETIITV
ncbi:carbamoyl phosphate synthase (plasmid) [Deltaproteobacteria bacterium Smac51]|nr:carbamoyl phosphate synthase [Deltaproteobacteria bacterium Smac51]